VLAPVKRSVFVSHHHRGDQAYYDMFSRLFADSLEVFQDTSLERAHDSESHDYVRWSIRQNHIAGSSCTIVLCGANTYERKYVDWEIKATLDKRHESSACGCQLSLSSARGRRSPTASRTTSTRTTRGGSRGRH